ADFLALEGEPAGEVRADGGVRVLLSRGDIRRPAHDLHRAAAATGIDGAETEPVGIGVLFHLEDLGDADVAEVLVERRDRVDGYAQSGQLRFELARSERAPEQRLEPATGDDHPRRSANCARTRMAL